MKPSGAVRLRLKEFPGSSTVCQGWQLANALAAVVSVAPDLSWYAAHVTSIGQSWNIEATHPAKIGQVTDLIEVARAVPQFGGGVFVGVPGGCTAPRFREGGLWTEDAPDADLGDGIVEVRAFDTTFIEVLSADAAILNGVARHYAARVEPL
jgi:hypothetical protein